MRYQVRRGLRMVLLVPLIAFLSGAGSATASYAAPAAGPVTVTTPAFTYVPLQVNVYVLPPAPKQSSQYTTVVMTPDFLMQKGDMRRVTDQLETQVPSGHGTQEDNQLSCYGQGGGNPVGQISSGTNSNDKLTHQWSVSLLLVAPATGEYYCQLQTYGLDKDPSSRMNVLAPAPGQTTSGTWLEYSSSNEANAGTWSWGLESDTTPCPPDDSKGICQYIGRSGRPPAIDVFDDEWAADPDATTFEAVASFQITDCWSTWYGKHTSSCPASDSGDGTGMSYAEGDTWLEVDQIATDGSVCAVNRAYNQESAGGQGQLSYHDSDSTHHQPLYYDLSAPVNQLCGGSRQFTVDLHIGWTAGNPVKIDGGNVSVIDNARATTTTVVPPVIGRTQAQADDAIEANGLTPFPPEYEESTAPVGTVLGENSPAGTIEPAGSPVQLTLAEGYATVPNVYHVPVAEAEGAIRSAGLKFHINMPVTTDCVHPSIVLGQTPSGGSLVAPGSTVYLGIRACPR